jgi:hypothetical protein
MILTRGSEYSEETPVFSASMPTINPTWTALRSNPGLCADRQATKPLSHGMANEGRNLNNEAA